MSQEAYAGIVCHLVHGLGRWLCVSSTQAHLALPSWAFWWVSVTFSPDGMSVEASLKRLGAGSINTLFNQEPVWLPTQFPAALTLLWVRVLGAGQGTPSLAPSSGGGSCQRHRVPFPDLPCLPWFNGEGSEKASPGGSPSLQDNVWVEILQGTGFCLHSLPAPSCFWQKVPVEHQPLSQLTGLGRAAQV